MAFPGTYNISYYKGDTFEFNVYPKDSSGAVFNMTSFDSTAKFTISEQRGSLTPTATGIAIIAGTKDYVACVIPPIEGAKLDASKTYVYDVQISYSSNPYDYVYTLLTGNISVTNDVTLVGALSAPNAPTNVTVTASTSDSITITWAAPTAGSEVTNYQVAYSTTPLDPESYIPVTPLLSSGTLTYTFTGLTPSTLYGLAVLSVNAGGSSAPAGTSGSTTA